MPKRHRSDSPPRRPASLPETADAFGPVLFLSELDRTAAHSHARPRSPLDSIDAMIAVVDDLLEAVRSCLDIFQANRLHLHVPTFSHMDVEMLGLAYRFDGCSDRPDDISTVMAFARQLGAIPTVVPLKHSMASVSLVLADLDKDRPGTTATPVRRLFQALAAPLDDQLRTCALPQIRAAMDAINRELARAGDTIAAMQADGSWAQSADTPSNAPSLAARLL
ncbi:hypothetical protein HK105_209321 [Polyrhizophydium stewartii]|uniref:Uncharacterized protein n=1 Tax=Polyrhizophydium stewartii TaxID=2732419 RepID=A0ABR4MVD3_9FUNG